MSAILIELHKLAELHKICLKLINISFAIRLQTICDCFLDTEYGFWPDGSSFESMDDFAYNLEFLDSVTFVEVALALAKTEPLKDFAEFKQEFENTLRLIHYANGRPNFVSRNHFMSVDWILNNKFLVEDITSTLSPNYKTAEALIDKLTWIKRHKVNRNPADELPESVAQIFQPQISRLPYIETNELLNNYTKFQEIFPEYGIVNIVRPNWDLTEQIGTHLNVSHLGFVFNDKATNQLSFYHATSIEQKVIKENLFSHMNRFKDIQTIRGINVLVISPGYHHAR